VRTFILYNLVSWINFTVQNSFSEHVNQLTPWSWALFEKSPVAQLLKSFQTFYGTRRFITVFARALHWSLSWARSIQSIPLHPISLKIHLNSIFLTTTNSS
jgi:hypothetical protein